MKLSIIIPAYNCEQFIEKTISSIAAEINNDVEIIIVDDGSNDHTFNICGRFQSENIHLIHQNNQGVSAARNKGIEMATGKYIMFVDADDTLIPGWFNTIRNLLDAGDDVIYFGVSYGDYEYTKIDIIKSMFGIPHTRSLDYMAAVWSKLFNRNMIQKNHVFFEQGIINGEDMLFSLDCIIHAQSYKFVAKPIYQYNINYNSATHTFNDSFIESNRIFLSKAFERLSQNQIPSTLRDECMRFSFINSVILLMFRISYISNAEERKNKYQLFNTSYITEGMRKTKLRFGEYGMGFYFLYLLISHRFYNLALLIIQLKHKSHSNQNSQYTII